MPSAKHSVPVTSKGSQVQGTTASLFTAVAVRTYPAPGQSMLSPATVRASAVAGASVGYRP